VDKNSHAAIAIQADKTYPVEILVEDLGSIPVHEL
jgi:hypothetical protein